jgi:lipopolysaccharide export LptBFGC system permease protein LptF
MMTWRELREYTRRLGNSGYNNAGERVGLHRRFAFPLAPVVMALLAIPFGISIGRKGALYGIGLATVIAASYFLVLTVLVAIGEAGLLHPALAAWGANILFGSSALFLMLTVRT